MAKHQAARTLLIGHLLSGGSCSTFADKHGISARTVRSWAASQDVRDAIREANRESARQILTILSRTGTRAAAQLLKLATKGSTEKIRLDASRTVLDQLVSISRYTDLEERMIALSERIADIESAGGATRSLPPRTQPDGY